jgi:hypothetical protein
MLESNIPLQVEPKPTIDLRNYRLPQPTTIRKLEPIGRLKTINHESGSVELEEPDSKGEMSLERNKFLKLSSSHESFVQSNRAHKDLKIR